MERYDLVAEEWETLQSIGERRAGAAVAVVRGRICVVGGRGGSTIPNSCTMYDPTGNTWCALPAMNEAWRAHGLVSVDDCHLYAFGGCGLSCMVRLDIGSVLDGAESVKWFMCPAIMLNPRGTQGRHGFGYCSSSGSGAGRDDTYICCTGGWATGDPHQRGSVLLWKEFTILLVMTGETAYFDMNYWCSSQQ